jgi:uncharacterized membrane protein
MQFNLSKFLYWLFIPRFNEVSLFSMSLTCILLVATNFNYNIEFTANPIDAGNYGIIGAYAVIFSGLLLSIFHAFSDRKKSSFEKIFMLLFASIISGFGGIWAGAYLWYNMEGWLRILPIWNIISAYILLVSVRDTNSIEQRISDENASLLEVGLGALVTVIIFSVSQYGFSLHWAATFSITVAYATNFNAPLLNLFIQTEEEAEKA